LQRLGSGARVIAGGHSLIPMMKLRLATPEYLIDINDLTELSYIREAGGEIRVGALTRHVELLKSELLAEHFPVFRDAEEVIAEVSAAVWITDGTIADVGIGLSALGPTTLEVTRAAERLRGDAPSEELFAQAGKIASEDCSPLPDGRGPVDYKRHLAGVLTK